VSAAGETVNLARLVYGRETPPLDDLAESYHEASKLNSTLSGLEMHGATLLEQHEALVWCTTRSVKEHAGYEPVALPAPRLPEAPFGSLLLERRSRSEFGPGSVSLTDLSTVLACGYGVSLLPPDDATGPHLHHRTVPSGGGLYPLELYVVALRVDQLDGGLYHYHPIHHRLERIAAGDQRPRLAPALVSESFLEAALALVVTGVFWRSRFKYGLRGYRFALFEAGHVAQNVLLAATALGLRACPCAGFFERRLDPLLEADGVEESSLYTIFVGTQH
jgi:SagB-type dehydrogenase family enzyme